MRVGGSIMRLWNLLSLSAAVAGLSWSITIPGIEGISWSTKIGYMVYCPLVLVGPLIYFYLGQVLRAKLSGAIYLVAALAWLVAGWVSAYYVSLALSLVLFMPAIRLPVLAFIPVGLPVTNMCFAAASLGFVVFAGMLLADFIKILRARSAERD
jgi:hypothetical protein